MGPRRILSESFCFRWLIGLRDNGGGFQPSIVRDVFTMDEVTIPSDDGGRATNSQSPTGSIVNMPVGDRAF